MTAELAVGLPALALMLIAGLTAIQAVTTQLRCVDAAREAVRAAARGEPGRAAGEREAPPGATVTISTGPDIVRASVTSTVRPLGPYLPSITVRADAAAAVEPGAAS